MTVKGFQGPSVKRIELAAKVKTLRDEGLLYREIVERLGISYTYAQQLYEDPDGAKARARKDGYAGKCVDCGAPTCGSGGPDEAPERCQDCANVQKHAERFWTGEQILLSFQRFHAETGRTPAASDATGFYPSQRDHFSDDRLAEIDSAPPLPHAWTVRREFGSWRGAIRAAGLTPANTGAPGHRSSRRLRGPSLETLRLLGSGPMTLASVAAARGIRVNGQSVILRRLLAEGLVVRSRHGVYQLAAPLTLDPKEKHVARTYVVLAKNGAGYIPLDTVEAVNPAHAIEKVATTEGTFIAVPATHWQEETVAPVTRFAVVAKETVAA